MGNAALFKCQRAGGCPKKQFITLDEDKFNGQSDPRRAYDSQFNDQIKLCKNCRIQEKLGADQEEDTHVELRCKARIYYDEEDKCFKADRNFHEWIDELQKEELDEQLKVMGSAFVERQRTISTHCTTNEDECDYMITDPDTFLPNIDMRDLKYY